MAGLRDLDSGKIYIGPEEPKKLDKSVETKNGDKPYDGTLAVTGPAFVGGHSPDAKGVLNVGTDLGDFKPNVTNRAVDVEGDAAIEGNITQRGNKFQDGEHTSTENITTKAHFIGDITQTSGTPPGCKVFDLPHPNIKGHRLRHACVEGPEAAVYVRGTVTIDGIIELPDYWQNFVDKETITVHLTPKETHQELFVKNIEYGKRITIRNSAGGPINAYYQVWGDRLGHDMVVEYEGESAADYPGDSSKFSAAGYDYDVRGYEHQWNHGDGA
tara:strand:+ start:1618 stop:2430 length:813 start_codon:yes stop_codon:yes gene_type:complete